MTRGEPRLVVISGPERSGKMPLARSLMQQDKLYAVRDILLDIARGA